MAEEKLARRFGELVRHLRREKGYSQEEFAFEVGLHQTLGTADRIAKALGTTLADLFAQLNTTIVNRKNSWHHVLSGEGGHDCFEWVPYLYPDLADGVSEADEGAAIEAGTINATGLRYVGTVA